MMQGNTSLSKFEPLKFASSFQDLFVGCFALIIKEAP